MSDKFVLITGCSGGGKSTLIAELRARGHCVVEEPGRRIVRQEISSGGRALPWVDPVAFARRAIEVALADREAARCYRGWVFFDRGLLDAACALGALIEAPILAELGAAHRYQRRVFMAPPWPQIYVTDAERRHPFDATLAEYDRLRAELPFLGYDLIELPKLSVARRADFVLTHLAGP